MFFGLFGNDVRMGEVRAGVVIICLGSLTLLDANDFRGG